MPFVDGNTVKGWGVFRQEPWHFVGVFPTKEAAEAKARDMGPGYIVAFGENREGTDDFVYTSIDNPSDA